MDVTGVVASVSRRHQCRSGGTRSHETGSGTGSTTGNSGRTAPPRPAASVRHPTSNRTSGSTSISTVREAGKTATSGNLTNGLIRRHQPINRSSFVWAPLLSSGAPKTSLPQRKPSGGGLMSRMNRLVTITPFRAKGSAPKPEEGSNQPRQWPNTKAQQPVDPLCKLGVSGIPMTPVVVATKHYKIRMDQRIHPAAMAPRSSASASRKQTTATST